MAVAGSMMMLEERLSGVDLWGGQADQSRPIHQTHPVDQLKETTTHHAPRVAAVLHRRPPAVVRAARRQHAHVQRADRRAETVLADTVEEIRGCLDQ
jgi:hypothetical protein